MLGRILKGLGIACLVVIFLLGAIEVWVLKNREKIFREIQNQVTQRIHGDLKIGDFKFRPFNGGLGLNFTLSDVLLTDTLYFEHQTPMLKADLIHVALDFNSFYKGEVKINNLVFQDGALRIFVRNDGYSNASIFKKNDEVADGEQDEKANLRELIGKLKRIRFLNFKAQFADSLTGKQYGALFQDAASGLIASDTAAVATFTGRVLFDGLIFKPEKGGFLMNQQTNVALTVSFQKRSFILLPSTLMTAHHDRIDMKGEFDLKDSVKKFNMHFESKGIAVDNALPLLTRRIHDQIDSIGIKTMVDTQVDIAGSLGPEKPNVVVAFQTKAFDFSMPLGTIRNVRAAGTFTNQADSTQLPSVENSRLISKAVKGQFNSLPFDFNLSVTNFRNPYAVLDGHFRADSINNLDQLLDPKRYRITKGKANIEFHFDGLLKKFFDTDKEKFNGSLWGTASLKDISVDYLPRGVHLTNLSGDFVFNELALVFQNLTFNDGQNDLFLKGRLIDLLPYLFGSKRPLQAVVDIDIPTWKLTWIEALLASNRQARPVRRKKVKLSDVLEDVIDNMTIAAQLNSKRMTYKRFEARNVKGDFIVKDNSIIIKKFQMNAFGKGRFEISGELDNNNPKTYPSMKMKGHLSNANISSVFSSFNNFGQKTVTSENIKGLLNADFQFQSGLNNEARLVPKSMYGDMKIDFRQGHLINFEPFLKMKRLIFKRRNFENVRFAPLIGEFKVRGEEIEVQPMEVESNVMTLFVDGVYSFGNKTNINIQIPLSNLKRRDSTYVLNPNDPSRKEGTNVYLRAEDDGSGEVNIKLAFRKKKDKLKEENSEK
ncbi:AsmA-like C-terminal region-containing protein [Dyadobacter tibetensis]|uniref:AsmA-like C-terminal region-containing protein n=1 Tax=Dyadobacter tibetensis TaxID=1211851 RepID=UPI00047162B9|nr:AsmA-like C-terminal region-containing protein [Dyadobacter tibetensis]